MLVPDNLSGLSGLLGLGTNSHLDVRPGFNPDLGSTGERRVWPVHNSARAVDENLMPVLVGLVGLHRDARQVRALFGVLAYVVLIDVNPFEHHATPLPGSRPVSAATYCRSSSIGILPGEL